jgi:hypothetical protein
MAVLRWQTVGGYVVAARTPQAKVVSPTDGQVHIGRLVKIRGWAWAVVGTCNRADIFQLTVDTRRHIPLLSSSGRTPPPACDYDTSTR